MNIYLRLLGFVLSKADSLKCLYRTERCRKQLGRGVNIAFPAQIAGVDNIVAEAPINIGVNSTLYTTNAKLIIKKHFISGPNLTIITGDHHYVIGKYLDSVKEEEKIPENDQDVIIEEDVWCGANVTILKGVTIGKGSIIAAGAVVTKSVLPYSVVGGIPAKVIKAKWTPKQIIEHERLLYNKK